MAFASAKFSFFGSISQFFSQGQGWRTEGVDFASFDFWKLIFSFLNMTDIDRSLDEIVQKMKRTTFFGIERNGSSFGNRRNSYHRHKQNSYGQNNGQRETRSYGLKHHVHFKRPFPNQPYRMSWRSNNKSHVSI